MRVAEFLTKNNNAHLSVGFDAGVFERMGGNRIWTISSIGEAAVSIGRLWDPCPMWSTKVGMETLNPFPLVGMET